MQLHQLIPTRKRSTKKRVGRGGKRGKTSGRGHKGQKARAGNSMRPEMREIIKKLPKLRGHGKNRAKAVHSGRITAVPVNVSSLDETFENGAEVTPKTLVAAGVLSRSRSKMPVVKILGSGELTKKLAVSGCAVSQSARGKIKKAGGKVM